MSRREATKFQGEIGFHSRRVIGWTTSVNAPSAVGISNDENRPLRFFGQRIIENPQKTQRHYIFSRHRDVVVDAPFPIAPRLLKKVEMVGGPMDGSL